MTKNQQSTLVGHDRLLQKQSHEMATMRAARCERHAMVSERIPKSYRLGPENPDGSLPIDVADRGTDNWRERETCRSADSARQRLKQLTAEARRVPEVSSEDRRRTRFGAAA